MLGGAQHRVLRDLRSRAGSGGHRDVGQPFATNRPPFSDDLQVVENLSLLRVHDRDGFPRIHGTASAESDYPITSLRSHHFRAFLDGLQGRLTHHRINNTGHSRFFEMLPQSRCALRITTRHDQHAASPVTTHRADLRQTTRSKNNPTRG